MNRHRAIATATLLGLLLAACKQSQPATNPAAAAPPTASAPASPDSLRQRAERAMREQRLFVPAGDNALEHFLALQRQDPGDAGVRAGLVDLQPLLVIAIEQAISRGALPEGQRLVGHLREMDANAPALARLQATLADARGLAQARAQATDPEALAKAEADAAVLRQKADANAERLAAARATPTPIPAGSVATGATAAVAATAVASTPLRQAAPMPARAEPVAATSPPPAVPTPASEPPRAAAIRTPRQLRVVAPVYPPTERSRALVGEVQIAFSISADGSVEDSRVVATSLPHVFSRAALTAVSRWKFEASGSRHQSQRTLVFTPSGS